VGDRLTEAAGDNLRTVLREDEGIHERQIHREAPAGGVCRYGQPGSAGSIVADATAVHARRVESSSVKPRRRARPSRMPAAVVLGRGEAAPQGA
jgi:hypothetical protein